jgi:hypothetical protein
MCHLHQPVRHFPKTGVASSAVHVWPYQIGSELRLWITARTGISPVTQSRDGSQRIVCNSEFRDPPWADKYAV